MKNESTTKFYEEYEAHFGGIILSSDYNTNHPGCRNVANRIVSDWNFDEYCKKCVEARNQRGREDKEPWIN